MGNWAEALQGLAAGTQGQLPAWRAANAREQEAAAYAQRAEQERRAKLDADRKLAWMQDNRVMLYHLKNNNPGLLGETIQNRLRGIEALNGDPKHTMAINDLYNAGKYDELQQLFQNLDDEAVLRGYMKPWPAQQGVERVSNSEIDDETGLITEWVPGKGYRTVPSGRPGKGTGSGAAKLTLAQKANNAEIRAARQALIAMDMDRDEVLRRSQEATATGRENPDYDPSIARLVNKATQHMVGDDPNFNTIYKKFMVDVPEVVDPPPPVAPAQEQPGLFERGMNAIGSMFSSEEDEQIDAILKANPGKDPEWAKRYLQHLKDNGRL